MWGWVDVSIVSLTFQKVGAGKRVSIVSLTFQKVGAGVGVLGHSRRLPLPRVRGVVSLLTQEQQRAAERQRAAESKREDRARENYPMKYQREQERLHHILPGHTNESSLCLCLPLSSALPLPLVIPMIHR